MNDHIPNDLCAFIEQTLASLPLGDARKRAMREEMLAHLLAVYDEEIARAHDERTAVAAALRRFGAPADLTSEFRAALSWRDWGFFHLFGRKGNLMRWLFLLLGVVGFFVGAGFVCPALQELLYVTGVVERTGLHHYPANSLVALSIVLLILGFALSLGGVWSVVHGVKMFRVGNS